jgi:hypothetical protein
MKAVSAAGDERDGRAAGGPTLGWSDLTSSDAISNHLVCEKKLSGYGCPLRKAGVQGDRSSETKEARSFALNGLRGFGPGETTRRRLESKRCARELQLAGAHHDN